MDVPESDDELTSIALGDEYDNGADDNDADDNGADDNGADGEQERKEEVVEESCPHDFAGTDRETELMNKSADLEESEVSTDEDESQRTYIPSQFVKEVEEQFCSKDNPRPTQSAPRTQAPIERLAATMLARVPRRSWPRPMGRHQLPL